MIRRWIRGIIQEWMWEEDARREMKAERALKLLDPDMKARYLLDNAHLTHHSSTSVLCWMLKLCAEKK